MSSPLLRDMSARPDVALAGGKAAGLYRLLDLSLPVPDFVVLTTDAYRLACRDGVVPAKLPQTVEKALDDTWDMLVGSPLAVRSSAVDEDTEERSYAGQMETFLNVSDRAALSRAVVGCWRSLEGERVKAYRATSESQQPSLVMAVVIQNMLRPDISGVLFTVNPVNSRSDELLVSSLWGLGEGLVSGSLDADTFVLDKAGGVKSRSIVEKKEQVVSADGGGTERQQISLDLANSPSLDDGILKELARMALQAEGAAGHPLDIEFAVASGRIYFLQARPVTGFTPCDKTRSSTRQVWDNSNIIESYSGITLPLTFSFIRMAYYAVYRQFCEVLGLPPGRIRKMDDVLQNMLGHIRGRVYYNLLNWYRLVSLLPGFQYNKEFMEGMMGLEKPDDLEHKPVSAFERYFVELPRLISTGWRALLLQLSLPRRIRRFHKDFDTKYERYARIDYNALQPQEALHYFHQMQQQILWHWKAPIINDFSAMIFYGILKKLTIAWDVAEDASIHNALICGQGDIESVKVTEHLLKVADLIASDKSLVQQVLSAPDARALELMRGNSRVWHTFQEYLQLYGDRAMAELKLESSTTRDDPIVCVQPLRNYLRNRDRGSGSLHSYDPVLREKAEAHVRERLKGKVTRLGIPKLTIYNWVLRNTKAAIRNRENQRMARTRAYSLVRQIFRSVGRNFHQNGIVDSPQDIFYLELDEVRSYVEGVSTDNDLRSLVRDRREEFERYRGMPAPPDHFVTFGLEYEDSIEVEDVAVHKAEVLAGLGACPGVVERPAVVMCEPDTSVKLEGEILVAHQTDPGWVVLFPSIGGLVVERGSMLSHSAIVAREMGIPAVVGVRGATRSVHTGDMLRLDGAKGTIRILQKKGNS